MNHMEDLTGHIFGRLTVIKRMPNPKNEVPYKRYPYKCVCICGNTCIAFRRSLKSGSKRSCGCLKKESVSRNAKSCMTHGKTKTKEFIAWQAIKTRCYNNKNSSYKNYGKRGIKVCKRWLASFEAFFEDMGLAPTSSHSIDRINNNGNYEPKNCRWATCVEQSLNRRTNFIVKYKGKALTIMEWSENIGMKYGTLHSRIVRGWTIEKALSERIK